MSCTVGDQEDFKGSTKFNREPVSQLKRTRGGSLVAMMRSF